jgi:hypothetical protein
VIELDCRSIKSLKANRNIVKGGCVDVRQEKT